MAYTEVFGVHDSLLESRVLYVEEWSILALGFGHCFEAADKVAIVVHDVVETYKLQEIPSRKHHEIGGWQDIGLDPLNSYHWVDQLDSQINDDQEQDLKLVRREMIRLLRIQECQSSQVSQSRS